MPSKFDDFFRALPVSQHVRTAALIDAFRLPLWSYPPEEFTPRISPIQELNPKNGQGVMHVDITSCFWSIKNALRVDNQHSGIFFFTRKALLKPLPIESRVQNLDLVLWSLIPPTLTISLSPHWKWHPNFGLQLLMPQPHPVWQGPHLYGLFLVGGGAGRAVLEAVVVVGLIPRAGGGVALAVPQAEDSTAPTRRKHYPLHPPRPQADQSLTIQPSKAPTPCRDEVTTRFDLGRGVTAQADGAQRTDHGAGVGHGEIVLAHMHRMPSQHAGRTAEPRRAVETSGEDVAQPMQPDATASSPTAGMALAVLHAEKWLWWCSRYPTRHVPELISPPRHFSSLRPLQPSPSSPRPRHVATEYSSWQCSLRCGPTAAHAGLLGGRTADLSLNAPQWSQECPCDMPDG
ncbi:hypothetical protein PAPYR_5802 [Paratrimastix pyriformis]|uniref:Uncharacterized protein n=1 Tax=Paratrimastix pyriformis TaxID=342808 RepID=A0ABQ8UKD3_9EUKA|nr:hypothetical protein PAPYR_5802 [Paratrimastix pyriformis]